MSGLFLKIINMSISAGWLVLAVVLLRLVLKRTPKWVNVLLWSAVAIRLICPVSIESGLSLIPSTETISPTIMTDPTPSVRTGFPALNRVINPVIGHSFAPTPGVSANPLQILVPILSLVWVIGIAVLILYAVISYWRLHRKVDTAVRCGDNLFQSEYAGSPFVLGIIKPKIYLPCHMEIESLNHVVAHERAHIRRKDHWWKPLGFLLLAIHWFNPLMWLAYALLCRDIELACDEKVIKELGDHQRADYTQALVSCSIKRSMIAACPLAFGEVGVKERVKTVMNYKKPTFWIILLTVVICVVVAVCFLTDPAEDTTEQKDNSYYLVIGTEGVETIQISGEQENGEIVKEDGTAFPKGEKVWLEQLEGVTNLRGISVTALGADGEILYALSIPEEMTDREVINLVGSDGWLLTPDNLVHVGKAYVYEKEGFPDSFTITLYGDGTFTYYEGMFSSYLGRGSWEQKDDMIVLTDEDLPLINHFRLDGEDLIFVEQDSSNFIYVQVADGERFSLTDPINRAENTVEKPKLTLEDVLSLSEKGQKLTWSNFEAYSYVETGSGLYIRVYEIDDLFELWIGGSGPDSEPMYIYLSLKEAIDTRIDIRDGDVQEFISADHSEVLLTNAIHDAIMEQNKPSKPDGLYRCADFVLLDKQELCIRSDPPTPMQVIAYGMALHQVFNFTDTGLYEAQGSHIPVALTFEVENGTYTLLEYWQPRDGSYYAQDIRDKFPDDVEEDALDTQKYIVSQMQNCYDQAVRYGGVDVAAEISYLLEVVASSPAYSSASGAYVDALPIEYRELMYYGHYTLRYSFEQFLKGQQTGLLMDIMASVCQDIMLGWGESYAIDGKQTGYDWFAEFRSNVESLKGQYSEEELRKQYPGAWQLTRIADPLCGYPPVTEMEWTPIDPVP